MSGIPVTGQFGGLLVAQNLRWPLSASAPHYGLQAESHNGEKPT
jgi:hypothetical protein